VPTLDLVVEPGDDDIHHHAVTDTLDKVDRRQLALGLTSAFRLRRAR